MPLHHSIIIGIVAGEVSGDILGAGLMRALKKCTNKRIYFFGIGGTYMQSEDMESWYDMQKLSVMGIFEIIRKLPKFVNILRDLTNRFLRLKIDIFIGIDFPDFNIILEKRLKNYGIRTVHYVSPSVWAWRRKRIFKLQKSTDNILLIFPFEKKFYDYYNIPCTFVGHALADKIPLYPDKIAIRKKLGVSKDACCLALLPGSRIGEIKILIKDFLVCAELLNDYFCNFEVLIPLVYPKFVEELINLQLKSIKLHIFDHQNSWEIMAASDVSLLASGTATLECMLAKCPMVVAYRMNPFTFMLIENFIKTSWISLPNLLANYRLVEECIQNDCNPINLTKKLLYLLKQDDNQRIILQRKFRQLHCSIKRNADMQAAIAVLELINSN